MKHLRIISGLALIPLCTALGSFVPFGTGSGILIGFVLGIAFSYLFLTYGPGHRKSQLPTSYSLSQQHQDNGGINQHAIDNATLSAWEATHYIRH
jgi:hypothetical protein